MEYVLETHALQKRYRSFAALDGCTMHVPKMRINSRPRKKKMTKGARSEIVRCEQTHQTILRDLPSQSE